MSMRQPGQHARETWRSLRNRNVAILLALLLPLGAAMLAWGPTSLLLFPVAVSVIGAVKLLEHHHLPVVQRWARGATGEETVGAALDELQPEWRVLHDYSTGRGNIDHIVVGPGGLFTVETKSHAWVRRIEPSWLKQAYAQSKHMEEITTRRFTPLLVFSRARITKPGARHRGVTVLPVD